MKILCLSFKGDCHDHGRKQVVETLESKGFDVVDLGKNLSYDAVFGACFSLEPDVLCISATLSSSYDTVVKHTAALKSFFNVVIICGGIAFKDKDADSSIDFICEDIPTLIKILESLDGRSNFISDP